MSFNLKKCTAAGPGSRSDPHYYLALTDAFIVALEEFFV